MAAVKNKKSYRLKVVLSLSNINTDFLQLILCMFVSHYILDNPLFGAALFLFTNIWIVYFEGNFRNIRILRRARPGVVMWILLFVSVVAGLALVFFFPTAMKRPEANYVSFFVAMVAARALLTFKVNDNYNKRKSSHRWFKALFQVLFVVPVMAWSFRLLNGPAFFAVVGGFALTGFLLSFQSSTLASFGKYMRRNARRNDKMRDINSYRVFSNMNLYSQIAFSLGILMYICYISFAQSAFVENAYLMMGAWLLLVIFSSEIFTWLVNKSGRLLSVNFFVAGAILWILGAVKMYGDSGVVMNMFWTFMWGFGLASLTSVMNRYNDDFKMIARVAGRKVTDRDLYFRGLFTQMIAVMISNVMMLILVTVWVFLVPNFRNADLPEAIRRIMIQLPVLFMAVSILFAIRQPLDRRSREKLENYDSGTSHNNPTRRNLTKTLVEKGRVKIGVKVLAGILRPLLHLRVVGAEHLERKDYPSIFICNHGLFYGPIAAVIYLPTYFRPWVDLKMIDPVLCAAEIYDRELYKAAWLPERFRRWLSRTLARPVTWALNSFDPIPVNKRSAHAAVATFASTVDVLAEGDNVLIFPEKPKRVRKKNKVTVAHERGTVGNLYTGFASIGRLYYEKTGKALKFYPIYADKPSRTFSIGEPVQFDPSNGPREEKQRIASEMHGRMLALRGEA